MPIISLPELDLYFETRGEGPPLLLLNGLGLDLTAWGPQIQTLSRAYRVLAFDARGTGRSGAPSHPYGISDLASDALAFLDALGVERAHVLGLSLGGFVAQQLAIHHPSRVKSLVLAATAARLPPRTRHVVELWRRMALGGTHPEILLGDQLAWMFSDRFFADGSWVSATVEMVLANPHRASSEAIAAQAAASLEHDTRAALSRIRIPTLVMVGRNDLLLPVSCAQELASSIPGAQLSVIEEAGHAFAVESSKRFNAVVLDFLTRLQAEAQSVW